MANEAVLASARTPHDTASPLSAFRSRADLSAERFVQERLTFFRHQLPAEILLRRQPVVRAATQSKVRNDMQALPAERLQMMKLEVASLAASLTPRIDIAASTAVPPLHLASFSRRNVPTALARRF